MHPKFLVGIYGSFDREKFSREWRPWFTGVEITSLSSWDEALRTVAFVKEQGTQFGVHHPLVKGRFSVDPHPLVSSCVADEMAHSMSVVRTALTEAKDLGAEYLLIHFPKPALLDTNLDWSDWRFVQRGEALPDSDVDRARVEAASRLAFAHLEALSREIGLPLVLEMDILHAWHYEGLIMELYQKHSGLGLCLDTGRLHLQTATDPEFDVVSFVQSVRQWVTNLHLWTVQLGQNKKGGHHPLLPELRPDEGWGHMGEMLDCLSAVDKAYVLFEHRSDLVSAEGLERCYHWVEDTLSGTAGDTITDTAI